MTTGEIILAHHDAEDVNVGWIECFESNDDLVVKSCVYVFLGQPYQTGELIDVESLQVCAVTGRKSKSAS